MVDRGGVMMRSLEIVGTYSTVTEAADALVERGPMTD
jgi:hypothetical protein